MLYKKNLKPWNFGTLDLVKLNDLKMAEISKMKLRLSCVDTQDVFDIFLNF
jgi:hypothetical protein